MVVHFIDQRIEEMAEDNPKLRESISGSQETLHDLQNSVLIELRARSVYESDAFCGDKGTVVFSVDTCDYDRNLVATLAEAVRKGKDWTYIAITSPCLNTDSHHQLCRVFLWVLKGGSRHEINRLYVLQTERKSIRELLSQSWTGSAVFVFEEDVGGFPV
jgi:hypothetical protein